MPESSAPMQATETRASAATVEPAKCLHWTIVERPGTARAGNVGSEGVVLTTA